ncbi:AAA family ATPase [Lactobacillus agilis]|uniref:AAA family ATPase n=1 Tax=Ligilactobacillus agilis TaxID=1601 RepID=A0A848C8M7_9LACO|nr:AAA family ATPase [Ligilactobacillus agilis]MCI5761911.1 AAA family ATPase [Ligilactobacillus agilis]MDY4065608.1 AAA family ATPase [Ligilactobacillus agilis]NME42407.1 AAA family ATPase [Ligilactobacillus agilis]
MNNGKRIVISGTYSTGKTTTTTALSLATGIPLINALSAREILTDLYPGRRFQDMTLDELLALGLKRLEERIRAENEAYMMNETHSFISDGSVLNELIYGTVRMKVGINPGSTVPHRIIKRVLGIPYKRFLRTYLDSYGVVVKNHAKEWYTDVIHLPIEFPMVSDGHRPVSEKYRILSDIEILETFRELGFIPNIVTGNVEERVKKIINDYKLPQTMDVSEACVKAKIIISKSRDAVSEKIISQYKEPTIKEKIKIATRY